MLREKDPYVMKTRIDVNLFTGCCFFIMEMNTALMDMDIKTEIIYTDSYIPVQDFRPTKILLNLKHMLIFYVGLYFLFLWGKKYVSSYEHSLKKLVLLR